MRKIYIESAAGRDTRDFWLNNWNNFSVSQMVNFCSMDPFADLLVRFLPRKGKILDAGCGLGQNVIYLRGLGFDVEGVDFSEGLLARALEYDSSLTVKTADLESLPYPDKYFKAYYAGGVIEHFEKGPHEILSEARRVLSDDGLLLVSVPFLNLMRRLEDILYFRAFMKKYNRIKKQGVPVLIYEQAGEPSLKRQALLPEGIDFYEYMFSVGEARRVLSQSGFKVFYNTPFSIMSGLCEFMAAKPPAGKPPAGRKPVSALKAGLKDFFIKEKVSSGPAAFLLKSARNCFGHMVFFVCRKN